MAVQRKTSAPKKAKVKNVTTDGTPKPVIQQVVEVVSEDIQKQEDALEEIKQDAQNIEHTVEVLEKQHEDDKEVNTVPDAKEQEKEVIEELFAKDDKGVAPEITSYKENNTTSLVVWIFIVIGVAVLTGFGLLLLVQGPSTVTSLFVKPTPSPTSTQTPTPTPAAVKRSDFIIQVLNGSGKAGAAAKMKQLLEEKGYTVKDVGNADTSDFDNTEIVVKKDKESAIVLLKEDLGSEYTIGKAESSLPDSSSSDARVTVGKE
ncbi:LytR C-terminal domain-containing protein [Candidatus Gottesmanbacteria bacterium]|nr:LytR C-terminal domain-containing protein [Candidatus Gottesmanbacteria bacterium]